MILIQKLPKTNFVIDYDLVWYHWLKYEKGEWEPEWETEPPFDKPIAWFHIIFNDVPRGAKCRYNLPAIHGQEKEGEILYLCILSPISQSLTHRVLIPPYFTSKSFIQMLNQPQSILCPRCNREVLEYEHRDTITFCPQARKLSFQVKFPRRGSEMGISV